MGLLLDAAYAAAGLVASPWLLFKAFTDGRFRHRFGERLGAAPRQDGTAPVLWVHAASVGEVNLVKPLVKRLLERRPGLRLHATTNTLQGWANAVKSWPDAPVSYFPIDFSPAVARALDRVRPSAVLLAELEVWPNFVAACVRRGIPVAVVNGRITERSFRRYRRFGWLFRPAFRALAAAGAQSEAHAERLRALGARPVVTGNLKYDTSIGFDPEAEGARWRSDLGLGDAPVLVAGSTHDPEERILVETYRRLQATYPRLRLVLAPRHLERVDEVKKAVEAADLRCYKKSLLHPPLPGDGVILLDTVGELSRLYSAATAVFIGGTFCARGGQNMLEPAALGKPIVSGPSLANFREIAGRLVDAGGMRVFDNPVEMGAALGQLLKEPERARAAGERARAAVEAGRGAIDATLRLLEKDVLKGI
ncbi:MAG TPA: 3-deoxy-D-manno-octulosonic acid transferase [Planctomycetota bacterium]|nr:3-deoxy-D-manno-octulosonic acid transferase [Planctomycetota bacterium]